MIPKSFQVKNSTTVGRLGEEIALRYLVNKGYALIQKNFHIQGGEIDLILQKNGIIIFVEVKLRTSKNFGSGVEALTRSKKQKLLRAIFTFLQKNQEPRQPQNFQKQSRPGAQISPLLWQLDLINIHYHQQNNTAFIQHFSNILEA